MEPRRVSASATPKSLGPATGEHAAEASVPQRRAPAAAATVAAAAAASVDGHTPRPAKRTRKESLPRSKAVAVAIAAAGAGAGEEGAVAGDFSVEDSALLGAREAKPKARAKATSRRGQKAEPLPLYTAALRKPPPPEGTPALKILSWNVAGLRALLKKHPDAISALVSREGAEVVCLQEHKLQEGHTREVEALLGLQGWHHHWACSRAKLGYSGVSLHTRTKPLSVMVGLGRGAAAALSNPAGATDPDPDPEHEVEGRVVTVELPAAYLVCVYVPNSGEGLKRLDYRVRRWDGAFAAYVQALEARGKPVVVTGDLNCAHKEIDIHAPKNNLRSAGFTVEERESFGRLLLGEVGLVDTFRSLFPGTVAYTYFTRRFNCREKNKGWRLDYFLTSAALMPSASAAAAVMVDATVQRPAGADADDGDDGGAAAVDEDGLTAKALTQTPWRVYDSWILQDVYGSDHLPLGLTLVRVASDPQ